MQTALQQVIDNLKIVQSATHTTEQHRAFNITIDIVEQYLEKEKEIIKDAYDEGWQKGYIKNYDGAKKYFDNTFNQ